MPVFYLSHVYIYIIIIKYMFQFFLKQIVLPSFTLHNRFITYQFFPGLPYRSNGFMAVLSSDSLSRRPGSHGSLILQVHLNVAFQLLIYIGSIYGIFTYIWLFINGKCRLIYQAHGSQRIKSWQDLDVASGKRT